MSQQRLQQEIVRLREQLQRCESRVRLAQHAINVFRQRFMPLAMSLPMLDTAEVLGQLTRIETVLAGGEEVPRG